MFGTILYSGSITTGEGIKQSYTEYELGEDHGVKVVVCVVENKPVMYRIEWEDERLGWSNEVTYDLMDAMTKFEVRSAAQLPPWLDALVARQDVVGRDNRAAQLRATWRRFSTR
jgi:hypothetical protein